MQINRRFWIYNNGPVKLTLHVDGSPLHHEEHHTHEEGWGASGASYRLDGNIVTREWWDDGTDCDGRLSHEGEDSCHVTRLSARWVGRCTRCGDTVIYIRGDGFPRCWVCDADRVAAPPGEIVWNERYPDWQREDSSQRDYAAEAMGY